MVSNTHDWIFNWLDYYHLCTSAYIRCDEQLLCTGSCNLNKTLKRYYPIHLNTTTSTLPSPRNGLHTKGKKFTCTLQAGSGLKKISPLDETPTHQVAKMVPIGGLQATRTRINHQSMIFICNRKPFADKKFFVILHGASLHVYQETAHTLESRFFIRKGIALALNGTHLHLQGENTVVLCTGLRKTRIKLKENKAPKIEAPKNWFMLSVIATRISLSCPRIEDYGSSCFSGKASRTRISHSKHARSTIFFCRMGFKLFVLGNLRLSWV